MAVSDANKTTPQFNPNQGRQPPPPLYTPSAPAPSGPSDLHQYFVNSFKDLPYAQSPAFQQVINSFEDPNIGNTSNADNWRQKIQGYADTFGSQFKNLAGRDPTADEYNTFFQQVILPENIGSSATPSQATIEQGAEGLIKNAFSGTIQDAVTKKAQGIADSAVAPGSAFDTWQKSMEANVKSTSDQLQDYQTKLFEKLRPQLLTSLQSQGLLDSGALNEAFAGKAADLTDASSNYIAGIQTQTDQNIANTKYGITSSPANTALQNTFATVPNLTQNGQQALQNAFNSSMMQQQYNNQLSLLNNQPNNQPSPLSQYGGLILGGLTSGAAYKYSDKRLKTNIQESNSLIDKVLKMNVVDFNYVPDFKLLNETETGLIAQEISDIHPSAVVKDKNGFLMIDYTAIVPLLIKSIQELNTRCVDLEKKYGK